MGAAHASRLTTSHSTLKPEIERTMRIRATGAMAAALLLANFAASASEWVEVGRAPDGTAFQIDVSSIRIEGPVRRAWGKSIPPSHTMKGAGENAKKFVSFSLS